MAPPSSKPLELPVVSYSILPLDQHEPPNLSQQPQFVQFGYNDGKEWTGYQECKDSQLEGRGGRYMRWIQPLESELAKQVEYDMDEQDKVWLDTFNSERKKEALLPIPYEIFEVIMDKLEKEWFDLTKSIPKKSNAIPSENEKCAICDDGECENSNAIVFCDGCNLAVHQDCYGVPYIPEGQWLCRKCTVSPDKPVDCVFCPQPFGAFKQTTTGHWGHLLCAIWIPETGVSNTVYMEPIDGVENVPKSRWKLNCYLCKKKFGACIQCSNRNCYTAYHVTCAREFGLEVRMKQPGSNTNSSGGELKSWCDKHGKVQWDLFSQSRASVPSSTRIPSQVSHHHQQQQHPALTSSTSLPSLPFNSPNLAQTPFALPQSSSSYAPSPLASTSTSLPFSPVPTNTNTTNSNSSNLPKPSTTTTTAVVPLASSKSLRSKKTHLSPIKQTPLIPQFIFERIVLYISKVKGLTGKKEVVSSISKYWSLKREGRTGAPLLKRIHLEPWTASATLRLQSDSDRASKLELIKLLRSDLEKVRMLTEQVRKREKKKLEKLKWFKETVLDGFVWSKENKLKTSLKEIISWDKQQYFLNPVDRELVPDYYQVIKNPMDWSTMNLKLDRHEYSTAKQFSDDANLVMQNAQTYNKPSSPIHKHSLKILEKLQPLLIKLVEELDNPLGDISLREQHLGPRLLLEEFEFDPDCENEDQAITTTTMEEGGGETQGQDREKKKEDKVIVMEELERVWYDVQDPLGDRKQKLLEAEKERIRLEEEAVKEAERIERERVAKERKEKEDAERAEREKEEAKEKERLEKEREIELEEQRKKKEQEKDVEMAPPPTEVKDTKKSKKRKAEDEGEKLPKVDHKKKKKDPQPCATPVPAPAPTMNGEQVAAAAVPETVISNRDTFKMFETGWVLPEGSSRRKTATPSSSTVPLPSTSTASEARPPSQPVASTSSSSSNQTPRTTAAPLPEVPPPSASTSTKPDPPQSVSTSKSRKGKEKAKEEESVADDKEIDSVEETKPSKITTATTTTTTNNVTDGVHPASSQAVLEWKSKFASLNSKVAVHEDTDLSDGVLVWHRLPGFTPFYPAEMADPKGSDMPRSLLASKPGAKRNSSASVVRFPLLYFDDGRSGSWALRSELRLLGEDKEFDQLMLQPAAVKAYCKQTKSQKQCVEYAEELTEAYEFAVSNVEIEGEEEEAEAGDVAAAGEGKKKKAKKSKSRRKSRAR